jgi:DNA-binding transcriptional LysR family regulator
VAAREEIDGRDGGPPESFCKIDQNDSFFLRTNEARAAELPPPVLFLAGGAAGSPDPRGRGPAHLAVGLSAQIRQLEDRLGETLFDRQGRRLVLSAAGQLVMAYADEIFGLGQEMLGRLQGGGDGVQRLRIGSVSTLSRNFQENWLRPALDNPAVMLSLESGTLEGLVARLKGHQLDVVLANETVPTTDPDHPCTAAWWAANRSRWWAPPRAGRAGSCASPRIWPAWTWPCPARATRCARSSTPCARRPTCARASGPRWTTWPCCVCWRATAAGWPCCPRWWCRTN